MDTLVVVNQKNSPENIRPGFSFKDEMKEFECHLGGWNLQWKMDLYGEEHWSWRDPFSTSMIVGGRVRRWTSTNQKPRNRNQKKNI